MDKDMAISGLAQTSYLQRVSSQSPYFNLMVVQIHDLLFTGTHYTQLFATIGYPQI